ncbi:hypothetical protein [Syntrophomonas palmitatica]|uniref:hypothetical protein n=1 Tax=Syntrophomonas palmitatica TaxID=402877 RepID=UPI0006D069FF|nr:hypothetical protein [Syntrophomonas palmitatica]
MKIFPLTKVITNKGMRSFKAENNARAFVFINRLHFSNSKGAAMLFVLGILFLAVFVAGILLQNSTNYHALSKQFDVHSQTRYLARSALDAIIEDWRNNDLMGTNTSVSFDKVYLDSSSIPPTDPNTTWKPFSFSLPAKNGGRIEAKIDYNSSSDPDPNLKNTYTITVTAYKPVGNTESKYTLKANSSKYINMINGNEIPTSIDPNRWFTIQSSPSRAYFVRGNSQSANGKTVYPHPELPGATVVFNPDPNTIELKSDEDCIGYGAKAIFFNKTVDLDSGFTQNALGLVAETVVFNQDLYLRDDILYEVLTGTWIHVSTGILALFVPDGYGIPGQNLDVASGRPSWASSYPSLWPTGTTYADKVDPNGTYGLVQFRGNVYIDSSLSNNHSNRSFYFKKNVINGQQQPLNISSLLNQNSQPNRDPSIPNFNWIFPNYPTHQQVFEHYINQGLLIPVNPASPDAGIILPRSTVEFNIKDN